MLTDLYNFRGKTLDIYFPITPVRVDNISNKDWLLSYLSEKYANTTEASITSQWAKVTSNSA